MPIENEKTETIVGDKKIIKEKIKTKSKPKTKITEIPLTKEEKEARDLDLIKREELQKLYNELNKRKANFGLLDTKLQEHQMPLLEAVKARNKDGSIKYKYLLFQGGNGSGKSFGALYTVILLALGEECHRYGLPYIGAKRSIFIGTKSGANIKNTIGHYLLATYSKLKIPDEQILDSKLDNGILKTLKLKSGATIEFFTYDQGYERIQGTNGDLYLLDEEPTKEDIFLEALARTRGKNSQMILSMTPLSGYTPVYSFFYEQESEKVKQVSWVKKVCSLSNVHADHTWTDGLTADERKMRLDGDFVPPSGLVYPNFSRYNNTIDFFDPKLLQDVNFYGAIDFGVTHPTAFAFIAVDADGFIYVFDLIYESNLLAKDLSRLIKEKLRKHNIELEYIIGDSADKRMRIELKEYGIKIRPVNKRVKGENDLSNRKAGITKVNQLLFDGKIYIASHLKEAIKEFENHFYKENGKRDGEVEKINDDFLRSRRFKIFYIGL